MDKVNANLAAIAAIEKKQIADLVEIYHREVPPAWKEHQEGVKAGIRYALIALGKRVDGIPTRRDEL